MRLRSPRARSIVALLAAVAPNRVRRLLHTRVLGYQLAPGAWIGHSLVLVDSLSMADGARIGHLSVLRNLERVELAEDAVVGNLVLVTAPKPGAGYFRGFHREPSLVLHNGAAITLLHFVDCSDRVEIGAFTTVGGVLTQILTHTVELETARQICKPVVIGERAFVGTGSIVLPGAVLGDRVVAAAGSVVRGELAEEGGLYTGVPARFRRTLDPSTRYFTRETAHMW